MYVFQGISDSLVCLFYYVNLVYCGNSWHIIEVGSAQVRPSHVEIREGTPVRAYCGSMSEITWTYNSKCVEIPQCPSVALDKRHLLGLKKVTFIDLKVNDTGYYTCHGDDYGVPFTAFIFIEVQRQAKYGQILPTWIEVPVGGSVTMTCGSLKPVKWISVHIEDQNKTVDGNTLIIHNLLRKHSGRYLCRGVTDLKKVFHVYALVIVNGVVEFEPYIYSL